MAQLIPLTEDSLQIVNTSESVSYSSTLCLFLQTTICSLSAYIIKWYSILMMMLNLIFPCLPTQKWVLCTLIASIYSFSSRCKHIPASGRFVVIQGISLVYLKRVQWCNWHTIECLNLLHVNFQFWHKAPL